ncbi:MAG: cell envelope integrity protein TolA [Alphaproteobacteria bacterium]
MNRAAIYSALLHMAVAGVAIFGLPRLWTPALAPDPPVLVELMTLSDLTRAPAPKAAAKSEARKPEPPKPRKASPMPPPAPPPAKAAPKPPAKVAALPALDAPRPKAKPKPPPKPRAKPKPPAPDRPRKIAIKPKSKPRAPDAFASVLKTVERLRARAPKTVADPVARPAPQVAARALRIGQRLTISELDAIRRQIEACWNVPAGARDAKNLIVDIWVAVNPDGSVRQARVVEASRMSTDPFFRSAAESAIRAVLNPRCNPLKLPPEKYEQWKTFTLSFNPREMLGS